MGSSHSQYNESYKSFNKLRNVIQNEIDKININCIKDAVNNKKKIFVDENMKDLIVSADIIYYNYVDHYFMFRNVRIRIRSSANISFNYKYMNKIEHIYRNKNYIYPKQMYMDNVISYLNNNKIPYYTYDPNTFTHDGVYIGCDTTHVSIPAHLNKYFN